jgi:hypothetical protein
VTTLTTAIKVDGALQAALTPPPLRQSPSRGFLLHQELCKRLSATSSPTCASIMAKQANAFPRFSAEAVVRLQRRRLRPTPEHPSASKMDIHREDSGVAVAHGATTCRSSYLRCLVLTHGDVVPMHLRFSHSFDQQCS